MTVDRILSPEMRGSYFSEAKCENCCENTILDAGIKVIEALVNQPDGSVGMQIRLSFVYASWIISAADSHGGLYQRWLG